MALMKFLSKMDVRLSIVVGALIVGAALILAAMHIHGDFDGMFNAYFRWSAERQVAAQVRAAYEKNEIFCQKKRIHVSSLDYEKVYFSENGERLNLTFILKFEPACATDGGVYLQRVDGRRYAGTLELKDFFGDNWENGIEPTKAKVDILVE
jgi:hypothetical protein